MEEYFPLIKTFLNLKKHDLHSFSAVTANGYAIMTSRDLNGGHWTVPSFHGQIVRIAASFIPKLLALLFPVEKERPGVPARAEVSVRGTGLPKGNGVKAN